MKRLNALLGVLLALGCSTGAFAANVVPTGATGPSGAYVPTQAAALWGMDGATACIIGGGDANCALPGANGASSAAANFTPAQVSVTGTATLIVAARTGRASVTILNTGATAIYLGPTSGVTTSNGMLLPGVAGASITLPYNGAVYGITTTGTQAVTEYELY